MRIISHSLVASLILVTFLRGSTCSPLALPGKALPSITYDTLVGYYDPKYQHGHTHSIQSITSDSEGDSQVSESVPGPISGPIMGYTAFRLVKSMLSDDPMSTLFYYSPLRVASRVANGMGAAGKTFASTFASEFQKSYDALSTGIKSRVGGGGGLKDLGSILTSRPHPPSYKESAWMDGI